MIDHLSNTIAAQRTFNGFFRKGGLACGYVHDETNREHDLSRQGRLKRKRYTIFRGPSAAIDSQ